MVMLCCGVVYTLHGRRSTEHAALAALSLGHLDLRELALRHLGLGVLSESVGLVEPSLMERVRLGLMLPDDVERLGLGLLLSDASGRTLKTEELEAGIVRTKERAELRRRQLESIAKTLVVAIGVLAVACLFLALSCWRRIVGAVVAVLAGAVVFIVLVIIGDSLQGIPEMEALA